MEFTSKMQVMKLIKDSIRKETPSTNGLDVTFTFALLFSQTNQGAKAIAETAW